MKPRTPNNRSLAKILPQLSLWLAVLYVPLVMVLKTTYAASSEQIQAAGTLTTPRANRTATILSDGRVLIVGGIGTNGVSATAEVFDPGTKEFTAVGNMSAPRAGHTATLLSDGRVLIAGGFDGMGSLQSA